MIELYIIVFIVGLLFGSFANVCIARIPKDESIIKPRSHCTKCNSLIRWYDNVPLVSYILLKAKCRNCGERISGQYPFVELLTAFLFLFTAIHFKLTIVLPFYLLFTLILIVISFIDYYHQIIPDVLSFGVVVLGIGLCLIDNATGLPLMKRILNTILGIVVGGGSLFLLGFIGEKILHKESMGGGDVKLMAGVGAMFGWSSIFPVLFIASLFGSVFGLTLIYTKRIERTGYIPFGPFLSFAAYLYMFLPNALNIMQLFNTQP